MALASQIEEAARTQTPSAGSGDRIDSVHLVPLVTTNPIEEQELRRAGRDIIRLAVWGGVADEIDDLIGAIGVTHEQIKPVPNWEMHSEQDDTTVTVLPAVPEEHAPARRIIESLPRLDWSEKAACRQFDPELWYPARDHGPSVDYEVEHAKQVCTFCPVVSECLRWALNRNEQHGIWGGMTEAERKSLRRRIQRGRAVA